MMSLLLALLHSDPAIAADPGTLNPTITAFNSHSVFDIPTLDDAQRTQLHRGDVVRLLNPVEGGNFQVVGLLIVPLPMKQVWLAGQDPHFSSAAATEHRLEVSGDRGVWYGFLDLPMGFSDRHWVVDVWNNHALAEVSGNTMWEHPWRLRDDGLPMARPFIERGDVGDLTVSKFDGAIFTPYNEGALVFIALNDAETLLIYHATSAVGGNIPVRLMAEFAKATMESFLGKIARNAAEVVPSHYSGDHAPLYGGDGEYLPLY